jgi:hypothetical protein
MGIGSYIDSSGIEVYLLQKSPLSTALAFFDGFLVIAFLLF